MVVKGVKRVISYWWKDEKTIVSIPWDGEEQE